jgi:hypothetical protein
MTLPIEWRSKSLSDLVRLGSGHDGGYVVPARTIHATELILSFGISDDWTFEADFARRNPRVRVIGYDPTITRNFWLKRSTGHFAAMIFRLDLGRASRLFDWFRYRAFFDGRRHEHRSIRVGYDGDRSESLNTILSAVPERRIFLKVDIEGSEYRVLDQIVSHAHQLTGVVIEFHDVDLMRDRISAFVSAVSSDLLLCHIHANNCAGVDGSGDPIALEMTFVSRLLLEPGERLEFGPLPSPLIDMPNDATKPDIWLRFDENANLPLSDRSVVANRE